ncbi:MAG: FAD-dependent oxidoreductase, partial [Gemmatimonadetes bacterium]|nr:FAD-dependent oxidoreductase [Gemmatimonadota bacterium]
MAIFDRRRFLQWIGAQAALLVPGLGRARTAPPDSWPEGGRAAAIQSQARPEVVVVGAGAFGGWTALYLREMGHSVALVDAYGPGNSRATSGDELRGIRAGYGDREVYTRWAIEALTRWRQRDEEWGKTLSRPLLAPTGRLILRRDWDNDLRETKRLLDKHRVPNEVFRHDELVRRYPQINMEGIGVGLFEPEGGLLRARQSCETVAQAFRQKGGNVVIARAEPGSRAGGRLQEVRVTPGQGLSAQSFVFACGPWLPKVFPDVMGNRLRTNQSHVYYVGTAPGDNRFMHPNLPNWDIPGSTGFPALEYDNRGMRVRIGGGPPADPDTVERRIDPGYFPQLRDFLAQWFPDLKDAPVLETRICLFENSVDSHYIIDRHPELENLWIAGGGSGHGFKMGPVTGEYVAKR